MDQWKKTIAEPIAHLLENVSAEEIEVMLEYPPNTELGDLSLPCFKLSRLVRKSPQTIALELKQRLEEMPAVASVIVEIEAVSGYLNLYLNKALFARQVIGEILQTWERYGEQDLGQGRTIVIDYSSPNIAKPFHIGHLRSTVIGNALNRIFACLGYRTIGINHLGDWGTQFGKLIVAFRLWGEEERLAEGPIDELLRLYVKFHEEAKERSELEDEARAWFVKLEQGDEDALRLWRRFVAVSKTEFDKVYQLLGVHFDYVTGESFYNDKTAAAIAELQEKKLLEEDGGAWLVRLDAFDMPPALMLKQDGSTLYHTRDVAAALYRKKAYDFHKVIYVTDYAQSLHFQQWFKVVQLMGYPWAENLVHVPFGRVSLQGASLSTRKGKVVKLEELLQQAILKTREIIERKNPHLEQKEEVAKQVGVGAVIFHDLSSNRIKDIVFSWKEALSFEGETGPYLQYTHARACSVLRKGVREENSREGQWQSKLAEDKKYDLLINSAENEVLKQLSLFPERIRQAADKMEPSIVSRYLIDLAQAFNRFYHDSPVLAEDNDLRDARLALVKCVQITLKNGLHLIGLQAPGRM